MVTVILIGAAVLMIAGLIVMVMMNGKARPAARTRIPTNPRGSVRSTTADD